MTSESIKRNFRIFRKYFLFLFLINLVVINWVDFGWVFNYRVAASTLANFFQKEEQVEELRSSHALAGASAIETVKAETAKTAPKIEIPQPKTTPKTATTALKQAEIKKDNLLEIPKIAIAAPIIFFDNPEENSEVLHGALDRGVIHFPDSVLPGETGQTIILGHSAPPNWPKIKYDWVFSQINNLAVADEIFVYYNAKKYSYSVIKKVFLEKGEEIDEPLTNSKNILVLISCWPPGKDLRRIAVEAAINK